MTILTGGLGSWANGWLGGGRNGRQGNRDQTKRDSRSANSTSGVNDVWGGSDVLVEILYDIYWDIDESTNSKNSSINLAKRDGSFGSFGFRVTNTTTETTQDVRIDENANGTGRIYVGLSQIHNEERKVKRSYAHYYPLCSGYLAVDYCRNTDTTYLSGLVETQGIAFAAAQHTFEGDWESSYYKVYLDDNTWLASWRYYYIKDGASVWFSSCDTGH